MPQTGCPWDELGPEAGFWLGCFRDYEQGVLWEGGGIGDQAAIYVQAMHVIASEMAAVRAEHLEAIKRSRGH